MISSEKLQEIGKFGYWRFNHQNKELFWSEQAYDVFGQVQEFVPTIDNFLSIIHPDERQPMIDVFNGECGDKDNQKVEHRHRIVLPNEIRHVVERCETTYTESSEKLETICVVQDITDKTIAIQKLKESEEKFRAISNQTAEGITVADMDGNYVFVNPAFCDMSGYTEEELLKLTVFDMKAPDQDHSSFRNSKEKYSGKALGVNLQRKDGKTYFTEIIGDVIHVDGETLVLGTIRDVSERVQQDREIQALNENLESLVEERTVKLNETVDRLHREIEQRILAEEQIMESLSVKETLLKEVTHRVKNNMQIISSIINLQKSSITDERCEFLDQIGHRIHSMALIHETLYKTEDFEFVEFNFYISSLIEYLKMSFEKPFISVSYSIDKVTLPLDTATCCGMIILELMTNSIKHAFEDDKGGEILISLRTDGNGKCMLVASDNGKGFPDKIDYRKSPSLGMQLVNSLVDQINGKISLDNSHGTKFALEFSVPELRK